MFNFNNLNNNFNNQNKEDNHSIQNGQNMNIQSNAMYNNSRTFNNGGIISFEALQKARQDLIGELDAIIEYDNHIHTTNVDIAKETWEDIKNEELVHIGELLALIVHLAPYQAPLIQSGVNEFEERLKNLKK